MKKKPINWHRLFGLLLGDYLSSRGFRVELEKDLSQKRQLLDVVVVEKIGEKADLSGICDGFDNFRRHNLITYKSGRESLGAWTIEELCAHYVNYRKIEGIKSTRADEISLYAVSTRRPKKLFATVNVEQVYKGVYSFKPIRHEIRIIILKELSLAHRNAALAFFSFDAAKIRFAMENYQWTFDDGSQVINQIFEKYNLEGFEMSYTVEDFRRDYIREHIEELGPEERLRGLKAEEILRGLKIEERLKGLKVQERLKGLSFRDLEELEEYIKEIKKKK